MNLEELIKGAERLGEEARIRRDAPGDTEDTKRFWAGRFAGIVDCIKILRDARQAQTEAPAPAPAPAEPWVYEPKPGDAEKEQAFHVKIELSFSGPSCEPRRRP